MQDRALGWLLANDPEAHDISGREYAAKMGILGVHQWADIRENEVSSSDPSRSFHCDACRRKSEQAWATVK
jgi:hypothetical protein